MSIEPVQTVLAALEAQGCNPRRSGTGWSARCPAHEDRKPSLSIGEGDDGRALLRCHTGCSPEAVCGALGLRLADLMPEHQRAVKGNGKREGDSARNGQTFPTVEDAKRYLEKRLGATTAAWDYYDAQGQLVGVVLRWDLPNGNKDIRPIARFPGGWRITAMPAPRPLYRLPEILAANPETTVVVVEGEKAADAARECALTATTSAGGAQAATRTDWSPLRGRRVLILPDNDPAGEQYAADVSKLVLQAGAREVRVLRLADAAFDFPPGGDLADVLESPHRCGLPLGENAGPTELGQWILERAAGSEPVPTTPADDFDFEPLWQPLAAIPPTDIEWLWPDRIPLGRITLVVGKPGCGKSFLCADFAARVSTGTPWPDGSACPRGGVLMMTLEDDPSDTIRPRLDAMHADVAKIGLLTGLTYKEADGRRAQRTITLADVAAIEKALQRQEDCRLLIVDPIGDFLGPRTDAHRDNEVRAVLSPLTELARRYKVAVLVVMHRRKAHAGDADDAALGSRGFTGIARAVWHVLRDRDDHKRRLFLPGKQNLAEDRGGLAFHIGGKPPSVIWEKDTVAMTADEGLAEEVTAGMRGRKPLAVEEAKAFLRSALGDGARPAKDLLAEWRETTGEGRRTLDRARGALGIMVFRPKNPGPWYWALPKGEDNPKPSTEIGGPSADCQNAKQGNFGNLAICVQKRGFDAISGADCQNSRFGDLEPAGGQSINSPTSEIPYSSTARGEECEVGEATTQESCPPRVVARRTQWSSPQISEWEVF